MKRIFILLIVLLGMAIAESVAMPRNTCQATAYAVTGRIVDEEAVAVEYATVVAMREGEQVAGMVTDAAGAFALLLPAGDYTLAVHYLGCEPLERAVRIPGDEATGDWVLKSAATAIEGVEVKAQLIRRESDRFIVDVANAPAVAGNDGIELLERAPGVWIEDDKISINGKSGSKVYINDRELKLPTEQLLTYLRSLRAEEIRRIEVIPVSGADYDADSASGIILITLRKRRDEGLNGSLSLSAGYQGGNSSYSSNGNIHARLGRVDLSASGWGYFQHQQIISRERTHYTQSRSRLESHSLLEEQDWNGGGTLGAVVELAPAHSVGAEFGFWHAYGPSETATESDFRTNDLTTRTESRFDSFEQTANYSVAFNYIWRIDTLGSTFKLLADYLYRANKTGNDNISQQRAADFTRDSLYRDLSKSRYDIVTATLALDKRFSTRWSLRAGLKYTRNDMQNDALYEYCRDEAWLRNEAQSFDVDYVEHIAAAYGIVSASLGRWSLVMGLRGELTHTSGRGFGQDYLSLFPNANLSYALTADGSYSLIAQYARTISRPNFWSLMPRRWQLSDYTYQEGNPYLDPSYKHEATLSLVMKHKYTLTAGVVVTTDDIEQTARPDPVNPDQIGVVWINYDNQTSYYATLNLPFQLTRWWQLNANLYYAYHGQRIDASEPERFQHIYMGSASTTFTLPRKFYIDLSYSYQGAVEFGNTRIDAMSRLHGGIKKRFGDKCTLGFTVRNIFEQDQHLQMYDERFVRNYSMTQFWTSRSYHFSLTYNFQSGKKLRHRTIESGSSEERGRL